MSMLSITVSVIVILLLIYLIYALLHAEDF